jgi:hypothetical protein
VAVSERKIRAVRRMVKQLPAEMLQQYSSANSFMQMPIIMLEQYAGCVYSTPFILNSQPYAVFQCFAIHL